MPLALEVRPLAIASRVAFDPAFARWPLSAFGHLLVLFPDIGLRPEPIQAGFIACEGELLPSSTSAAYQVHEHLAGLATIL